MRIVVESVPTFVEHRSIKVKRRWGISLRYVYAKWAGFDNEEKTLPFMDFMCFLYCTVRNTKPIKIQM